MDDRIKYIIEKRKQVGWTIRQLANMAGLSYGEALHVERKGIYCETYVTKLTKAVDEALRVFLDQDLDKALDKAIAIKDSELKSDEASEIIIKKSDNKIQRISQKKDRKWSNQHEKCVKCGTTEKKHTAHGLCRTCYDYFNENRQKAHSRTYGIAGKRITKGYLVREYIIKKKSLTDIAKECFCTRQFIKKKMNEFKIPSRNLSPILSINNFDRLGIVTLQTIFLKYCHHNPIGHS